MPRMNSCRNPSDTLCRRFLPLCLSRAQDRHPIDGGVRVYANVAHRSSSHGQLPALSALFPAIHCPPRFPAVVVDATYRPFFARLSTHTFPLPPTPTRHAVRAVIHQAPWPTTFPPPRSAGYQHQPCLRYDRPLPVVHTVNKTRSGNLHPALSLACRRQPMPRAASIKTQALWLHSTAQGA